MVGGGWENFVSSYLDDFYKFLDLHGRIFKDCCLWNDESEERNMHTQNETMSSMVFCLGGFRRFSADLYGTTAIWGWCRIFLSSLAYPSFMVLKTYITLPFLSICSCPYLSISFQLQSCLFCIGIGCRFSTSNGFSNLLLRFKDYSFDILWLIYALTKFYQVYRLMC